MGVDAKVVEEKLEEREEIKSNNPHLAGGEKQDQSWIPFSCLFWATWCTHKHTHTYIYIYIYIYLYLIYIYAYMMSMYLLYCTYNVYVYKI